MHHVRRKMYLGKDYIQTRQEEQTRSVMTDEHESWDETVASEARR